jgi:hypothetical protein
MMSLVLMHDNGRQGRAGQLQFRGLSVVEFRKVLKQEHRAFLMTTSM